jgi:cytoskeletal protein CcmA (bactofilin family)
MSASFVTPVVSQEVNAIIAQGCQFEGKLCFQGLARIGGLFKGEIFTPDTLVISEGALVEGVIRAGVIIVCGTVQGTLHAEHRIEILRPGVFRGELSSPSLKVEEGVIFEGRSRNVLESSAEAFENF